MKMYEIRKKFRIEMAHQLTNAYSKCCIDSIHGHSYVIEIFFSSRQLDDDGMVIDFGYVKDKINDYIDSWDHALVMSEDMDAAYLAMLQEFNKNLKIVNYNPTAENMARDIFDNVRGLLGDFLKIIYVSRVRVHETETGYAEYTEME